MDNYDDLELEMLVDFMMDNPATQGDLTTDQLLGLTEAQYDGETDRDV